MLLHLKSVEIWYCIDREDRRGAHFVSRVLFYLIPQFRQRNKNACKPSARSGMERGEFSTTVTYPLCIIV